MTRRHGSGHHQGTNPFEVSRIVTFCNADSEGRQICRARWVHVAATHRNSAAAGNQCERTHSRSTDSHEVNGALIRGVEQGHV
jgi:hypothetical protein